MKTNVLRIVALLLMLIMVLSACAPLSNNGGDEESGDVTTEENVTGIPTTNELTTDEPTTDTLTTTEAPTTEELTTEELTTEDPTTDSSVNEPIVNKDLKILMIGNSFCYYFVEELYAIAKADGLNLTVANLYASGCSVGEHWQNGVTNKDRYYEFYVTSNRGGRKKVSEATTLDYALEYREWDVISLQQHFYPVMAMNYDLALSQTESNAKNLYDYIRTKNPTADLYWHQTWAYQVGYPVAGSDTPIDNVETQTLTHNNIKAVSQIIAQDNSVNLIPAGDAWQVARADSRVGDVLCARLGANDGLGDCYHDGDIGGGQYLNACVWYEVLTRQSCIGNTWRPNYELSEERIAALQEAAHAAVAAVYGENYVE